MVNTNVQSPVSLIGRGYTQRDTTAYESGEYPQLENIQITERGLVGRSGIRAMDNNYYSVNLGNLSRYYTDICGFIGKFGGPIGDQLILMGKNALFSANYDPTTGYGGDPYWAPETLQAGQTNAAYHVPVKAFQYRNFSYFVTQRLAGANMEYRIGVQGALGVVPALTLVITRAFATTYSYDFVDAFVFKDRLWIITRDTIYFSGVGTANFTNFTAPVGGFFTYASNIKSVESLKDTLYVICENEVYNLTYNSDPNSDSTNILISRDQGGDCSCIHENTVYFTDGATLYTINSHNVSRVLDLLLFQRPPRSGNGNYATLSSNPSVRTKMVVYKNKIYLIYRDPVRFWAEASATDHISRGAKLPFKAEVTDNYMNTTHSNYSNVFSINMENGSISKIVFEEIHDTTKFGCITDGMVAIDNNGNSVLFFMTSTHRRDSVGQGQLNSTFNFVYRYTDYSDTYATIVNASNEVFDSYYYTVNGVLIASSTVNVPFAVTLKSLTPDGNEYLMKKFRSLHIMGNLPHDTKIDATIDNRNVSNSLGTIVDKTDQYQDPRSYRFRIMARARAISIHIYLPAPREIGVGDDIINYDRPFITDLRTYWTYTGKPQDTVAGKT